MQTWFPMLFLFILGLLAGVVVNHLATVLPAHRNVPVPYCPYCGRERPWWQWLTLPSFLVSRAYCPHCGAPLRLRYPLVELGLATAYVYLWGTLGANVNIRLVLYLVYGAIFAIILVTDIERRLILNRVTYPAIILAFLASFVTPGMTWWSALTGGLIGFVFFSVAALIGNRLFGDGALGGGDIKLAAFIGLITGFPLIVEALVLTLLIGAGVSLLLLITHVRRRRDHIPYGPFLVIGAIITLLHGYPIAHWFLSR